MKNIKLLTSKHQYKLGRLSSLIVVLLSAMFFAVGSIHAQEEEAAVESATEAEGEATETVTESSEVTLIPDTEEELAGPKEQIIVTGSRIKRDEFSSVSPIQVITAERSALAGLLDTNDILQGATVAPGQQIDDSFSGFVTDGGPGANSISLRGLGAQRTLVLVNGKRWGPSGVRGATNSVDLTAIPSSIVSRFEILKDGASSIYGADAVAGVVNLITKERQDGFQVNVSSSIPADGGGQFNSLDGVWGKIGADWSFNVAFDYARLEELRRAERDFAACDTRPRITDQDGDGNIDNRDPSTGEELCFGPIFGLVSSPFGFVRYEPSLAPGVGPENPNFDPLVNGTFGIPFFTTVAEGPLDNQGAFYRDTTSADVEQIIPVSERISVTSFAEKDVELFGRQSTAYAEFYYNKRDTEANGGYQQLFPTVGPNNPTNPFGTNGPLADFGGFPVIPVIMSTNVLDPVDRIEVERTNTFVGLKGDLTENWTYDAYVGYSESSGTYESQRILEDRLLASLDSSFDAGGNLVCNNAAGFPGCVAANWFDSVLLSGQFSPEYLNFIRKDTRGKTDYETVQFSANATGPLFEMPAGDVQAVFGVEWRRDEINDVPDIEAQRDNIFSTTSSGITAGTDTVREAFVEFEFPLLKDKAFAEELSVNVAARYTDYNSYGDDITERLQINWQVNPTLRLRATNGTSFRAPDLFEQFLGNQTGFADGFLDPCVNYGQDFNPGDVVYDNCASQGLAPDFGVNGVPSIQTITGGNPDLLAEESDSTTIGVVLTPQNIDLSLAINYFDIELENSVASPTVGFVVGDCYTSAGLSSPFCSLLGPRTPQGNLSFVDASLLNIGVERTSGYDLDLVYEKEFPAFSIIADFTATYIDEQFIDLLGDELELEGRWGFPEWTGELDLYLDWRDWRFLWSINYIGSSEEEPVFDPNTTNRDRFNRTDASFYHTISARYTSPNDWQVIATIRNVFDEEPPLISDGQGSNSAGRVFNTLPGVGYDLIGPTFVLQFSKSFGG
ncbi:MAG: TonB-dependent receptor [Pseudomonadota bacterium]